MDRSALVCGIEMLNRKLGKSEFFFLGIQTKLKFKQFFSLQYGSSCFWKNKSGYIFHFFGI